MEKTDETSGQTNNGPECDINKTAIISELLTTPISDRNEAWQKNFLSEVRTASFACGDPQISTGPDGFPYFVLKSPEPMQPFTSFCISNLKDNFVLDHGYGIVINPVGNGADWVFSYGDILNLQLNDEFFTVADHSLLQRSETTAADEEVLVGQPSESYLPLITRDIMRSFMEYIGVNQPQVLLLVQKKGEQAVQQLVFNIFPEDFASDEDLNFRMQQLSWFLPRHYIISSIPKSSSLKDNFADL